MDRTDNENVIPRNLLGVPTKEITSSFANGCQYDLTLSGPRTTADQQTIRENRTSSLLEDLGTSVPVFAVVSKLWSCHLTEGCQLNSTRCAYLPSNSSSTQASIERITSSCLAVVVCAGDAALGGRFRLASLVLAGLGLTSLQIVGKLNL